MPCNKSTKRKRINLAKSGLGNEHLAEQQFGNVVLGLCSDFLNPKEQILNDGLWCRGRRWGDPAGAGRQWQNRRRELRKHQPEPLGSMLEESEFHSALHRRPSHPGPPVQLHVYVSREAIVNGLDPGVKWTQSSIGAPMRM